MYKNIYQKENIFILPSIIDIRILSHKMNIESHLFYTVVALMFN